MKQSFFRSTHRSLLALLTLFPVVLWATAAPAQQAAPGPGSTTAQQVPAASTQAISQTGLLPVYGVDLQVDPSWVDGSQFPSQSADFPNSGTSATLQQIWGALQPGGYNVLRIALNVRDTTFSANRAANLCVWAKANNVQLIITMTGADPGKAIPADFAGKASDFVKALVGLMRANSGQYLANYSQIMALQIEQEINHSGRHGGMKEDQAQKLALAAAHAVRSAETEALNGSGLSATPLTTSTSFDFDLVSAGAIAGGTLTDAAYSQAYQAIKQSLTGLAASPDLDLLVVDWYPGSVGGGGVEKAPEFLKALLADVPGKQLVLGTGFSTAFRSSDEQKRLFTTSFANLSDFRASNGTGCLFAGVIFREAVNGKNPNPNPPRSTLPGDMDKWDWNAKATELNAMWTQGKKSDDMKWWLTKVENNMGLVSLQNDASGNVAATALPAQQGMTQIASAVSDANSQMATNPASSPYANGLASTAASATTPDPNAGAYANPYAQQPQPTAAPAATSDPNASAYANPYAQPQPPGSPVTAYGTDPNQAQPGVANPYGAAPSAYSPPGCTPNPQIPTDPNAAYGQMPATGCSPATPGFGTAAGFQAFAQQGMMGLLNNVLQRLAGMASGAGKSGFNGSNANAYTNNYNNPNPYNTTPGATDPNSPANAYNSTTNFATPGAYSTPTPSPTDPNYPTNTAANYANPAAAGQTGAFSNTGASSQPTGTSPSNYGSPSQPSAPPVAVQIGSQDISVQPGNLQVGTSATISVTVHNQGPTDASGLIVQASGSDGTTLGQQTNVHVSPNLSASVQLPWSPSAASSSYGITVSVSDGSGNTLTSAQSSPMAISSPANTTTTNNSTSGGTSSGTGSVNGTTGTGVSTGTGSTDPNAGNGTSTGSSNTTGTGGSVGGTTSTGSDPGCGNSAGNTPGVPTAISRRMINCNGGPGGKTSNPLGSLKLSMIQVGIPGQKVIAGQPATILVPVLNPYTVAIGNIQATLMIDGKSTQTQTLDIVMPQQSRSISFSGITFAQSGTHQVAVNVVNQRPGATPLTSIATRSVNIIDASSATTAGNGPGNAGNTTQAANAGSSDPTSSGTTGTVAGNTTTGASGSAANATGAGNSSGPSTANASGSGNPGTTSSGAGTTTAATNGSAPTAVTGNGFVAGTTIIAGPAVRSVLPNTFVIGRAVLPSATSTAQNPRSAPANINRPPVAASGQSSPASAANSLPSAATATPKQMANAAKSAPAASTVIPTQATNVGAPTAPAATPAAAPNVSTSAPSAPTVTPGKPAAGSAPAVSSAAVPVVTPTAPVRSIGTTAPTIAPTRPGAATTPNATNGVAPPSANAAPSATPISPSSTPGAPPPSAAPTVSPNAPAVRAIGGAGGAGATTPPTVLPGRPGPGVAPNAQPGAVSAVRTITPGPANAPTVQPSGALARPGPNGATTVQGTPANPNALNRPSPAGVTTIAPNANALNRPGPAGGTATPPSSNTVLPGRPGGPPTTGATPPGGASAQGFVDLSVTTNEIRINPVTPRVGQMATFAASVHNLGTANAQSAVVIFNLFVKGAQVGASQPMAINVPAHGAFQASWSAMIPAGQQYQVVVTVNAPGDVNLANNRAALVFTSAAR